MGLRPHVGPHIVHLSGPSLWVGPPSYLIEPNGSEVWRSRMEEKSEQGEPISEETDAGADLPRDETAAPVAESVKAKAPEVEVHLFRQGRGPVAVFRSKLGGWDQDRLEVQDILDKYGFKSLFAFNPSSGRGVSIRFSPRNGRSLLPYADGAVIFVDGEPKVSIS